MTSKCFLLNSVSPILLNNAPVCDLSTYKQTYYQNVTTCKSKLIFNFLPHLSSAHQLAGRTVQLTELYIYFTFISYDNSNIHQTLHYMSSYNPIIHQCSIHYSSILFPCPSIFTVMCLPKQGISNLKFLLTLDTTLSVYHHSHLIRVQSGNKASKHRCQNLTTTPEENAPLVDRIH